MNQRMQKNAVLSGLGYAIFGALLGAGFTHFIPFVQRKNGAIFGALIFLAVWGYRRLVDKDQARGRMAPGDAYPATVADEIRRFDELRKSGAISDQEYEQAKRRLLSELN